MAITDAGGNFTGTDVEAALAELAAGSTDDQTISTDGTAGNIGIEDGNSITLNVNDADADATNEIQDISTDGTAGDISLSSGSNLTLNVDDADADATNEYNTGVSITAGSLGVTDGGGTQSTSLISTDANNDLAAGTDGALYLNVASVTIAETNTSLSFNDTNNQLTYTNELGNNPVVDLSALDDSGTDDQTLATDGTAGNISIEDGNAITLNVDDADADATNEIQDADEVAITDAGGNFTGTDVEAALAELAAGSTDDQTVSTDGTAGNISIEDGNSITLNVNDADADATNEIQDLGEVLTEGNDGGGAAITNIADPTNAQDAATKAYVDAIADDDITAASLDGSNVLTISEGTTDVTVNLSALVDDADADASNELQTISRSGTDVTLSDGGGTVSIADNDNDSSNEIQDISTDGTAGDISLSSGSSLTLNVDDADADATNEIQDADEVAITDAGGNFTGTDVEAALAELAAGSTDDQTISTDGTAGNIGIEDGNSITLNVNDADADATNEIQDISTDGTAGDISLSSGSSLTLNVDDADADATNEIQDLGEVLTEGNDGGGAAITNIADPTNAQDAATKAYVDAIADDDITAASLDGSNVLTISEGTTDVTVNLSALVDDADADASNELQTISRSGTDVTLSDGGGTVSIADNDNDSSNEIQDISTDGTAGDISLSSGSSLTLNVNDADADATNEIQDLGEVLTEGNDGGGAAITNIADPTNAQDAATKAYVDAIADDDITAASLDGSNVLTISEGTTDVTVNLSALVDDADADASNELQTISRSGTDVTLSDGGGTVSVADNDNDSTNEIELPTGGTNGQVLSTDGSGVYSWIDDNGGTDDQEADEVDLATDVDLDEDGTDETTVQEALDALAAMPKIYATGKINANGTAAAIYNATVSKLTTNNGGGGTEGDYQITFSSALANTNYIIQLTIPDCGGNCPGNTSANFDDPGITYYDQQTSGFKVNIGDSDNGTTQKDDIDLDFMFTVIVIPN